MVSGVRVAVGDRTEVGEVPRRCSGGRGRGGEQVEERRRLRSVGRHGSSGRLVSRGGGRQYQVDGEAGPRLVPGHIADVQVDVVQAPSEATTVPGDRLVGGAPAAGDAHTVGRQVPVGDPTAPVLDDDQNTEGLATTRAERRDRVQVHERSDAVNVDAQAFGGGVASHVYRSQLDVVASIAQGDRTAIGTPPAAIDPHVQAGQT